MDKKFLKAKDIAQLWGITPRRVNQLCTAGFINGAYKEGRYWLIPSDTTKPEILRNKQNPPLSGRLLPCPVGITSYKEVSKECYYVDKTLLIKDIIDDHSKVYLFTRPRRFGKTLTMDMIRTYFEKHPQIHPYIFQIKKSGIAEMLTSSFRGLIRSFFFLLKMRIRLTGLICTAVCVLP